MRAERLRLLAAWTGRPLWFAGALPRAPGFNPNRKAGGQTAGGLPGEADLLPEFGSAARAILFAFCWRALGASASARELPGGPFRPVASASSSA
jgi:hypothetical protein